MRISDAIVERAQLRDRDEHQRRRDGLDCRLRQPCPGLLLHHHALGTVALHLEAMSLKLSTMSVTSVAPPAIRRTRAARRDYEPIARREPCNATKNAPQRVAERHAEAAFERSATTFDARRISPPGLTQLMRPEQSCILLDSPRCHPSPLSGAIS